MSVDALARLLVPLRGEDRTIGQAVIRSWNPETFESVVEYDGLLLENLPVGSGIEALTYRAGDVVLIEGAFPGGQRGELGLGSYFIARRIIAPGSGAAEQAIQFMQTTLAKAISAQVFAERVHVHQTLSQAFFSTSTGLSFVSHPQSQPAKLENIEITSAGKAVVLGSAILSINRTDTSQIDGSIAVDISGATTKAASVDTSLAGMGNFGYIGAHTVRTSRIRVFDDLNEGLHTFEIKYHASLTTGTYAFDQTAIVVIAY